MRKSEFDYLCENFGDPSLPVTERWKAIRYIFVENPLMDVQFLLKHHEIMYIDNDSVSPGFYILGTPNANIEPINKGFVISFIPLSLIDKIAFVTDYIKIESGPSQVSKPNILNGDNPIVEGISFNTNTDDFSTIIE